MPRCSFCIRLDFKCDFLGEQEWDDGDCTECINAGSPCDVTVALADRDETEIPKEVDWEVISQNKELIDKQEAEAMATILRLQQERRVWVAREKNLSDWSIRFLDELAKEEREEKERLKREEKERLKGKEKERLKEGKGKEPTPAPVELMTVNPDEDVNPHHLHRTSCYKKVEGYRGRRLACGSETIAELASREREERSSPYHMRISGTCHGKTIPYRGPRMIGRLLHQSSLVRAERAARRLMNASFLGDTSLFEDEESTSEETEKEIVRGSNDTAETMVVALVN
ncbi:hypothetical protein B7494_g8489 [Chlorociboria aeruginascens]|nr:hypothetical protein B7494_g8489 [Chlorociboria aeruginascens]